MKDAGIKPPPSTAKASDKKETELRDSIVGDPVRRSRSPSSSSACSISCRSTARTGQTFGMRNRQIKVVRVDGSPVTWWAAFVRFFIPLAICSCS